jgi:predicted RNA-binding protein with RPS1 domain
MQNDNNKLRGFKIGLSGAIPERKYWSDRPLDIEILSFIHNFSAIVMKYGGTIVHGMHPTFTPILLKLAERFKRGGDQVPLILIGSELWLKHLPSDKKMQIKAVSELIEVKQVGQGDSNDPSVRNESLTKMRKVLTRSMNIYVGIGGKYHKNSEITPGVYEEYNIAKQRNLPCFIIPALGGMTADLFENSDEFELYKNSNKMSDDDILFLNNISRISLYPGFLFNHFVHNHSLIERNRDSRGPSLNIKQPAEDSWELATRALRKGDLVRGIVTKITDYGVVLEILEGLEGLIHVSQLTWSSLVKHPQKYFKIGEEIEAKVLILDRVQKRIHLGVKQLQADPWDSILNNVHEGDVLEGIVTSVGKFGASVQVFEEIEGLIDFNDYSWDDRVDQKLLKKGDKVTFKVLEINIPLRNIYCGIKQLSENPYETLYKKYNKGDVISCRVTRIYTFGLFVDIEEGLEGLIHISRVPLEEGQKLKDVFIVGDDITAVILNIDPHDNKIALSIKKRPTGRKEPKLFKKEEDAFTTRIGKPAE